MSVYAHLDSTNTIVERLSPDGPISELYSAQFVAALVDISSMTPAPQVGWTGTQQNGVWSFAAPPAPPAPDLAQQAGGAMGAGLTLTLSGSLTLAATVFPTDPVTQSKIAAVVTTLVATGAFPGGGASYPMKDAAGAWHTLNAAQYKVVAGAIATYAAALDLIIDGNPTNASGLPAASVSLTV